LLQELISVRHLAQSGGNMEGKEVRFGIATQRFLPTVTPTQAAVL